MSFPNGLVPTTERVHPTPIYELIVACAIAWVLWRMGELQGARFVEDVAQESKAARIRVPVVPIGRRATMRNVFLEIPTKHWSKVFRWLRPGSVFAAYLVMTGAARFFVEFIRINPRSFFGLTNAQAASALSMIAGATLWWRVARGKTHA